MTSILQRSLLKSAKAKTVQRTLTSCATMNRVDESKYSFETLAVSAPHDFVLHVELNRPEQKNSMTHQMWKEMVSCWTTAASDENVRSIILSARGRLFTAGLDLMEAAQSIMPKPGQEVSRRAFELMTVIRNAQESCTVIEKCLKPTICAIHGACIGGGIDLSTACDVRYATDDAFFSVKEVDIGLAADMGTLQRLPRVIGNESLARELCFTARRFTAKEAFQQGMLSRTFHDKESMLAEAMNIAQQIAAKSPVAIQGTKHNLNYSRDHTVDEGLEHMTLWNASMLQTEDILKSAQASMTKQDLKTVTFSKL